MKTKVTVRGIWALLILIVLAGCDQHVGPPETTSGPEPAARSAGESAPRTATEAPARAAGNAATGVRWTPPARWESLGQRPMRVATYRVPAAAGDAEGGECAVFFFGAGQGGDVDANLKRWYGQFEQPGGKSSEKAAKTGKQTIAGLRVTNVDLSGTYLASAGPMSPVKESKPGYRLLGAIVEAPEGNLFFKFTGPAKTITVSEGDFQALLQSLRKE